MLDATVEQSEAAHIEDLERQSDLDRARIAELERQAVVDKSEIANLHEALVASRRIGAAMGILMATHKITEETAFDVLRVASQSRHRKLRDVADDVVQTGTLES